MLLGTRCFPLIPLCSQISASPRLQIRLSTYSTQRYGNDFYSLGHSSLTDAGESGPWQAEMKGRQYTLRTALDNLAQDFLDLSHYLSNAYAERQQLLNRKTNKYQLSSRLKDDDGDPKSSLLAEINTIEQSITNLDNQITRARQREIPTTSFYIRLRRVHGRLPNHQLPLAHSTTDALAGTRLSNAILSSLLSLPAPKILDDLARHLLTTSLPITENSFFLMIHRLSNLRLGSAARSAYHNLIASGYAPTSVQAISLLLRLTSSIRDRREFYRLQSLINKFNISHDAYIYSGLITGSLKMGSRSNAFKHFRAMIAEGIQPSLHVLTSMLHDCGSRRDWLLGAEVWRSMNLGQSDGRFQIDAWGYNKMWRLCRRCHQRNAAAQVLRSAVRQGFELEGILYYRRKKYKSLPIRNTNKSPELEDVQNSIERAFVDGVVFPGEARKPVGNDSLSMQRSFREFNEDHRGEKRSIQARRRMDKLMLNRERTLRNSSSQIAELSQLDLAKPVTRTLENHADDLYHSKDKDEHLLDIIQEESISFLSSWFISSTTTSDRTTTGKELKSRQSAPSFISEMALSCPVPLTKASPARPSSGGNHQCHSHRPPSRRPLRVFVPRSKMKRNSANVVAT